MLGETLSLVLLSLFPAMPIVDCNDNGIDDSTDIASGYSTDCNHNGIPDECDYPVNYGWANLQKRTSSSFSPFNSYSVAQGSDGSVYNAGYFTGEIDFDPSSGTDLRSSPAGKTSVFMSKFLGNGSYGWTMTWDPSSFINASSVTVDPSGDVVMVGDFFGTVDFNPGSGTDSRTTTNNAAYIVKLHSDGSYAWTDIIDSTSSGTVLPRCVVTDSTGNILLTGGFTQSIDFNPTAGVDAKTSSGGRDTFITQLHSDGSYGWTKVFVNTTTSTAYEGGMGLAVDSNNDFVVTGLFADTVDFDTGNGTDLRTSTGNTDGFVTKFNANGSYAWTQTWGGTTADGGSSVAIGGDHEINIAGLYNSPSEKTKISLRRYSSNGTFRWFKDEFGFEYINYDPFAVAFTVYPGPGVGADGLGNAYITSANKLYLASYFPDGDYRLSVNTTGLNSIGGNRLSVDSTGANVVISGNVVGIHDFDPTCSTDSKGASYGNVFTIKLKPVIPCYWDLDDNGLVGGGDLGILLGAWGTNPGGPPDFNNDGIVDGLDLGELLGHWGPCP